MTEAQPHILSPRLLVTVWLALLALTAARAHFAANRDGYTAASQPIVDDLIRRMDIAMSPYFY